MITVKKYSNRRLYDTSRSCYVTLEELAETIRQGEEVRVIDAKSNDDLTQQVLAQIILESRGASGLLPVPLLTELIRMGDDALAEFFGRYMSWALQIYMVTKRNARQMVKISPFGHLPIDAAGQSLARMLTGLGAWGPDTSSYPPPPPVQADIEPLAPEPEAAEPEAEDNQEVAALRREIEELKTLMHAALGDKKDSA